MPVGLLRYHAEILVIDIPFHMWTETQQLSPCEYSSKKTNANFEHNPDPILLVLLYEMEKFQFSILMFKVKSLQYIATDHASVNHKLILYLDNNFYLALSCLIFKFLLELGYLFGQ